MRIQDALEPTGKARKEDNKADYAYLILSENSDRHDLVWYVKGLLPENVQYEDFLGHDWQPYVEDEKIRPEKAGELWEDNNGELYFIVRQDHLNYFQTIDGLQRFTLDIDGTWDRFQDIVHGENGWTREYPSVRDK